jgi:hypothetical protein
MMAGVKATTGRGAWCLVLLFGWFNLPAEADAQLGNSDGAWQMTPGEDRIELRFNGDLVTAYHIGEVPRPFFYPIIGPGGVAVTRSYPMEKGPDEEETDHVHHRSLWFSHGEVNGINFWGDREGDGRQRHTGLKGVRIKPESISLTTANDWLAASGATVLQDAREYTLSKAQNGALIIDFQITLQATVGPVVFGDSKEGSLGLRMAHWMRLVKKDRKTPQPTASVVNSEGVTGKAVWGKRAEWIDYFATDPKGKTIGIAVMDHPSNLRHPTWWHARDYGLLGANPFGEGSFEKQTPKGAGDFTLADGDELTLRWRLVVHPGKPERAGVAELFEAFAGE